MTATITKTIDVEVGVDIDDFSIDEIITELMARDLSGWSKRVLATIKLDFDNCIIINNEIVFEIKTLADRIRVEEFIEAERQK